MSLSYYRLQLAQFNRTLEDTLRNIVRKNEKQIIALVKNRLYQRGVDGSGEQISPSYAASTEAYKKERGKRASFVTLRETGLFYQGFYLELVKYDLILNSSDSKTSYLIDKYGAPILEFTSVEQAFILNEIIDPALQKELDQLTFNSSSATGDIDILE